MTGQSPAFDRNAAARYLDSVFGTRHGDVLLSLGHGGYWTDKGKYAHRTWQDGVRFAWPGECDRLLGEVARELSAGPVDVFVCPYLREHGAPRAKGNASVRMLIHADYDAGKPIPDEIAAELAKLSAFLVASGTEHNRHVYIPLADPITAAEHEGMCRALGAKLGGCDAKVSDNDVLRLPGTLNYKTSPPSPVTWATRPRGYRKTAAGVRDALGVAPALSAVTARPARQPAAPAVTSLTPGELAALPPPVRQALAHVSSPPDRSADTMRVIGACKDAGLALSQVRAVIASRPDLAARLAERDDDDVLTCWLKVDADAPNQATALYALAHKHYRLIRTEDGETYAVRRDGPNIAIPVARGGLFGAHLIRLFYKAEGKVPSDQAETSAVKLMRAELADQDPEPVHLRVAPHRGGVVLDLGTADGACVVITADGWRVEPRSPVVFRRGAGLPLPEPQRDVDGLARLRVLVNASDDQFRLGVAWLVAALIPAMPHPILLPRGEQGSAKTTLSRIFQAVIDPSGLTPGALPRDERDFAVRMTAAYVQAFDNVSGLNSRGLWWLSDALCRAATGNTFATRTLYTDRDITILQYSRPIILNTIDAGALNGDLVERSLPLDLDRIPPEKRRTERAVIGDDPDANPGLYDQLDKDRPVILGAILDLVSDVLRHVPQVTTGTLPRMADFGRVLAALDAAQGWSIGGVFSDLVDSETGALIEGSPFASRLVEFMENRGEWSGTATALLDELTALLPDKDRPPKGWPADAPRGGGQLKRLAPSLRVHGIEATCELKGKARTRTWQIRKILSALSALSATPDDLGEQADSKADSNGSADSRRSVPLDALSAMSPQVDSGFDSLADSADSNSAANSRGGWPEGSYGAAAITDSYAWPVSETGPCTKCGTPCHRYGEGGHSLCAQCQNGRPTPRVMPQHKRN